MGVPLDDPLTAIASALAATEAARTARVVFRSGMDGSALRLSRPSDLRGRGAERFNPLRLVVRPLAHGVMRFAGPHEAEGVVDFARRLVAMDFGAYAVIVEGEREWGGLSGRARSTLPEHRAGPSQPLWLVDLLHGMVEAEPAGDEVVRGMPCRRLAGRADLGRAERDGGRPVAVPEASRIEELHAVPIDCWIGRDGLVRRVRVQMRSRITGVDLFDFGVPVERDWPDMPTFRTPVADG